MKKYDYIILGGGISGLTFARLLQLHTDKTFLIIEKESEVGGLCKTKEIAGNHFDIGGGHFLHSKYQEVYDFIFSHLPESEFNKFDRVTKIQLGDDLIDFPIEENLWQLPEKKQLKYIESLIECGYKIHAKRKEGYSFKDWCYDAFGKEITNNYMIPYNTKIWGVDPDEMSVDWLYKIPKPDLSNVIKSIIFKSANKENLPSHNYFYYPKIGGFSRIIEAIYEEIKSGMEVSFSDIILNESITKIDRILKADHDTSSKLDSIGDFNDLWVINNKFKASRIINTIPWEALPENFTIKKMAAISELKHNSLVVSFHEDKNAHSLHKDQYHWKYIPDLDIAHHREFMLRHYCLSNKKSFIARETNLNRYIPANEECHINEYAYPIPLKGKDIAIKQILGYYESLNVFGLGRWGTWQYHNSDVCIRQAMDLVNKLEKTEL